MFVLVFDRPSRSHTIVPTEAVWRACPTAVKQTRRNGAAMGTKLTCAVTDGRFTADTFPPDGCKLNNNNNNN